MNRMPEYEENYITISPHEYCCPFCGGVKWHDMKHTTGEVLKRWAGSTWIERIYCVNPRGDSLIIAECATCGATASGFYSRVM